MAKERKVPDFTDNQREQIKKIEQDVLNKRPADTQAPAPRPMLPSYYAKGGQVGKVGGFGLNNRSKPDFAGGGPKTNFKFSSKKGEM
jgi:hypothetical protein